MPQWTPNPAITTDGFKTYGRVRNPHVGSALRIYTCRRAVGSSAQCWAALRQRTATARFHKKFELAWSWFDRAVSSEMAASMRSWLHSPEAKSPFRALSTLPMTFWIQSENRDDPCQWTSGWMDNSTSRNPALRNSRYRRRP